MLPIRIIPCLDVDEGQVFKGVKFKDLQPAGAPVELARRYYQAGADELAFLDIGATPKSRKTLSAIVEKVAREIFIPLTVGGGIRSLEDMESILKAGADKIAICSAALDNPVLLQAGAAKFGSQCIVLSIDARRQNETWLACKGGGRVATGSDVVTWARTGERLGAGEILLNSIDKDGTREGYDLPLLQAVGAAVNIPVIASGGAGTLEQILKAVEVGKADAILLASLLHYGEVSIPQIKEYLRARGVPVRC